MGVGLFFIFVACAGVSIIVWVFNWICWLNQCCCCDFLHNPVNKRIAWWMSFIFLLGILASCIAGCVSVNRFGFALEGARCAVDRMYYDSMNGQLKIDEPKWRGFTNQILILGNISNFVTSVTTGTENKLEEPKDLDDIPSNIIKQIKTVIQGIRDLNVDHRTQIKDIINSIIDKLDPKKNDFERFKSHFLNEGFYRFEGILKGWMKYLAMVYFCLLLITVTFAAVSMMFYACLKRQGYLLTFMQILWNIIRFFMVSFFIYGTAYGIFYLILIDCIGLINYMFSNLYLRNQKDDSLLPKSSGENINFLEQCLSENNYNYKNMIDKELKQYRIYLEQFFYYYQELIKHLDEKDNSNDYYKCYKKENKATLCDDLYWIELDKLAEKGGLFDSFNCQFLHNDLNILYKALYDASEESENLAAASLCASFFGAVAVYFYLLVLHHYNNEMFFDSGKSIFKGFDGYGGGFKKKNIQQDPAYKKRKLRAEIELTSKNDDAGGYNKDINKNDDEE